MIDDRALAGTGVNGTANAVIYAGTPILESAITCPECGAEKVETMPTNACQFFYDCSGCGAVLRPKPGHCCVFCSYGTVPCPPIQADGSASSCCGEAGAGAPAGQ